MKSIYLYRLQPPRPDFSRTMSDEELHTMGRHAAHWGALMAQGHCLVFAPVPDETGDWGMAIAVAPDAGTVAEWGESDPAVTSGLMTFSLLELPFAVTPANVGPVGSPA